MGPREESEARTSGRRSASAARYVPQSLIADLILKYIILQIYIGLSLRGGENVYITSHLGTSRWVTLKKPRNSMVRVFTPTVYIPQHPNAPLTHRSSNRERALKYAGPQPRTTDRPGRYTRFVCSPTSLLSTPY